MCSYRWTRTISRHRNLHQLMLVSLSCRQLHSLSEAFSQLAFFRGIRVPVDYLDLSLQAMLHLNKCGKPMCCMNLRGVLVWIVKTIQIHCFLYKLRMPFGLLQYAVGFFQCQNHPSGIIVKKIIVASIPSYICWYAHAGWCMQHHCFHHYFRFRLARQITASG